MVRGKLMCCKEHTDYFLTQVRINLNQTGTCIMQSSGVIVTKEYCTEKKVKPVPPCMFLQDLIQLKKSGFAYNYSNGYKRCDKSCLDILRRVVVDFSLQKYIHCAPNSKGVVPPSPPLKKVFGTLCVHAAANHQINSADEVSNFF